MMKQLLTTLLVCAMAVTTAVAQRSQRPARNPLRETAPAFFTTSEASRIGDQVLLYQRVTGGWPKNIDMSRPLSDEERAQVEADKQRRDDSTTDNNATTMQMDFLARLFQATHDKRYAQAFGRAVDYLLEGQYDNGGWPQFWPDPKGYQVHITFNDDAMVNTMTLLRDISQQQAPYQGRLTTKAQRKRARAAFDKGVECILKTQIRVDGQPTVWCQQHDRETYAPAPARAYELPSFCTQESAYIVRLLMQLPNPDERVLQAVHGAMAWFEQNKLTGWRLMRTGQWGSPDRDTKLVADSAAGPLWGRFYDLEECRPYVCDRDGVPRRHLEEIGPERRNGYSWYNARPAELYDTYRQWADKYDPQHKVNL